MLAFEGAPPKLSASNRKQDVLPQTTAGELTEKNQRQIVRDLDAAFERVRIKTSLKDSEKLDILQGMVRTRHLDARLKKLFMSGEVKLPNGQSFQGKGFRSTGQEAIYAAGLRLKKQPECANPEDYTGDIVAPMIRDLGLALAMGLKPFDVMAAQMGKMGKPTFGKDIHVGDWAIGVLPPAAPITISTCTMAGVGLALRDTGRVAINCNGDGGISSGEWHESINFAAVQKLPIVFVLQNNQIALSTSTNEQFACDILAEKAAGYGIRGITVDGTDPEAVFASVTEAADACRKGEGPAIVELVSMRMCGHAHHDDMLYFGAEPDDFINYPELKEGAYIDPEKYAFWRSKDPIQTYKRRLMDEGVLTERKFERLTQNVSEEIETAAQQLIAADWPPADDAARPVVAGGSWLFALENHAENDKAFPEIAFWNSDEPIGFEANKDGKTFWQAIDEALAEEMRRDPNTFLLGEDIGGGYGNAFVILKQLQEEFGDRLMNTPLAESVILGAATGAALLGKRPIAEMQFNDFVASGFNQVVNNMAKIYARWRQPVPVTIRMPWGGLRSAGPYHSQNTEAWFYRTPGLKIVCPSTPVEAKALLKAAIRDDNPVMFYEHIALYRAADIKQVLPSEKDDFVLPIGKAHLKKEGKDVSIITYGAYVHRCLKAAAALENEGISCEVLDLRSILPLDKDAILATVAKTGRALIVHEDSKTGGVGQSVASIIAEEAFEFLDAPIRVLGALDAPVPYSPPLEEAFLVSNEQIVSEVRQLAAY